MGDIPKAKDVNQLQSFIIPNLKTVLDLLWDKYENYQKQKEVIRTEDLDMC